MLVEHYSEARCFVVLMTDHRPCYPAFAFRLPQSQLCIYPALPGVVFEGQCSGTYAASIRYTSVDIEGTTGIMEVNENATTEQVIHVIGPVDGTTIGANSRVQFVIARSAFTGIGVALT